MDWDLSCPDWEQRLREGRSLIPDLPLWQDRADLALGVFRSMHLADVIGTPTIGELGDDWMCDLVRVIFGSVEPKTGKRAIREVLGMVPKKNNKTTGAALLMLTALLLNRRQRAKFILAGPTQDAAELAYAAAEGAIKLCPVKRAKLHVRGHLKRIEHLGSGAMLEIMSFDPAVLTGQRPAGVLVDELHVCAKAHKAASALRQLRGGMLSYPEAFLVMITTQSEERPTGVFEAELKRARAIRDGHETGQLLPLLYEFPRSMQQDRAEWMNRANWHMVNPNWGRSVDVDRLDALYQDALVKGDAEVRAWASQHLNVEIGIALRADAWAGAEQWAEAVDETLTLEALIDRSEVCTVGIDGGGLDDLLGLTFIGRERGTRRWLWWSRAWAHPIVLQRRKEIASTLLDFAADGDLVMVDAIGEDLAEAADLVARVRDAGLLPERAAIGLDPAGIGSMVDALAERDITGEMLVGIPQGWRLNGAIKATERGLAQGTLVHAPQRLMDWCVGNARVEPRGNAVTITKAAAGSAKIDPLSAGFNAVELMARNPAAATLEGVF